MPESFGARLRQRREEQNIALNTVAEQTKIKLSLLEALERDDVSHWPSGIFRRAYVRAYADSIGLSPDVVLREFLEAHPEPAAVDPAAAAMTFAAERAAAGAGPPSRLRNIVGSAIESLSRIRRYSAVDDRAPAEGHRTKDEPASDGVRRPVSVPDDNALHAQPREANASACSVDDEARDDVLAANAAAGSEPAIGTAGAPANEILNREPAEPVTAPNDRSHQPEQAILAARGKEPLSTPDFAALADVCTSLGQVGSAAEVQTVLQEVAVVLGASGLIVWIWDDSAGELRAALAHGYSNRVLAQLPGVAADADNATAAAFRLAQPCVTGGSGHINGALVVPLLTPAGCAGVLALELQHGAELSAGIRAAATIVSAMLAQLVGGEASASQTEAIVPPKATTPIRVNVRSERRAWTP